MAGRKQTATMELAIGATIIAGVIILIVMLMAWGNSTSFLGRHYRVVVNMVNVGGLKEGAPVKMGGFQIGRVASIQIRPGGTDMEIVLDIDEAHLLPKGSTAKVSTAGLVGDAFMEIVPGKSADMVKRASTVAEAEKLDSASVPDISELFTKVNEFGDQITILTTNLNDIAGDAQFRKSVKSLATNMEAVSYQANLILQRGQNVVDNIEKASLNVANLSDSIRQSVEEVTTDIERVSGIALEVAEHAKGTIENLDGGITDIRRGVNSTIGDPEVAAHLKSVIRNLDTTTTSIAKRTDDIDAMVGNLNTLSEDLKAITTKVREISTHIEGASLANTMNSLTGAIESMTEVVEQIKKEPVLALSVNKAANRIVKMKFDEMSRQPQFKTSDEVLREINRWIRENMDRKYMTDPKFNYESRPYTLER